jgi:GNAT superfamily N-acetyltransferase
MAITIRNFEPADQQAVKKLILSGLADHWGTINQDLNPDLNAIERTYSDAIFLVAVKHEEIIGCGAIIRRNNITGEIVRMSVDRKLRRKGIGKLVLDALCDRARQAGYRRLVLETTVDWKGVRTFYEAFGFKYTHFIDDEFGGQAHYEYHL